MPSEDGQHYILQKISELEKQLIKARDAKKALYKKYKRGFNITDAVDTTLISAEVNIAGVGLTAPIMLPLQVTAIVCGALGLSVKFMRRNLISKIQKHYGINTLADSKLNSIKG